MMNRFKISLILAFAPFVLAAGAFQPKHTKLTVAQDKSHLVFEIQTIGDIEVTKQGPWELKITPQDPKESLGLNLSKKGELVHRSASFKFLDKTKAQAQVALAKGAKPGTFDYKLRAFVCTTDKSRCFPEIHRGSFKTSQGK